MQLYLKQILTIARLTALEAIRQPITFLLFASTIILIGLLPLVLSHTLGESEKFVRDGSLAFMLIAGLILGAHAACATLTYELQRGTVSTVLSKPVQRPVFLFAKFCGIAGVIALYAAGTTLTVLIAVRTVNQPYVTDWHAAIPLFFAWLGAFVVGGLINFFLRRPFTSNAFMLLLGFIVIAFLYTAWHGPDGQTIAFGALYDFRIFAAAFLVALAILVLASISVALATRFTTTPTLSICGALLLLGLLSDYLFGRHAHTHWIANVLHRLLPNWQHFWVVDVLGADGTIPVAYLAQATSYALFYLAAVLCFAVLVFDRMEVKT